jgi:type I restriction-modification system DNA methylase subunit
VTKHTYRVDQEIELSNRDSSNSLQQTNSCKVGLLSMPTQRFSLQNYNAEIYIEHVKAFGLESTWAQILHHVQLNGCNDFLNPGNFGVMYEAGLAENDKHKKKRSGQYFTPSDVSNLMSSWLSELKGANICDVGCGTGNLILAYLNQLKREEALSLIKGKRIYLFDYDHIAITIAQYSIALMYGIEYLEDINVVHGDFLCEEIKIPKDSRVISNPPYAKFETAPSAWRNTRIQLETRELYAAFMEKIILSSNSAVIITPYSFLGGSKFKELRNLLSRYNGFIIAFDNVPGNIFNGRKHGVFNTNTTNSVRAAITVVQNIPDREGFKITPLIRFKNEEREQLLKSEVLIDQLSDIYQRTNSKTTMFAKCHNELLECLDLWVTKSSVTLNEFISKSETEFTLFMPSTCRYFTTASRKKLKRNGFYSVSLSDPDRFNFLYCLLNSSFAYWWWRIYDGGITYQVSLLNSLPIFYDLLSTDDKNFFSHTAIEMMSIENEFIVTKMNAGSIQENIKFPKRYRSRINERFLRILRCDIPETTFNVVHKNSFFGKLKESNEEDE